MRFLSFFESCWVISTWEHPQCRSECLHSLLQICWDESCWRRFRCCSRHPSSKTSRLWRWSRPGALIEPKAWSEDLKNWERAWRPTRQSKTALQVSGLSSELDLETFTVWPSVMSSTLSWNLTEVSSLAKMILPDIPGCWWSAMLKIQTTANNTL